MDMDRKPYFSECNSFRLLSGLALALGLLSLVMGLPQSVRADAGGIPTRTPTRTATLLPTATLTLIPTATQASNDQTLIEPTALPVGDITPTVDLAPLLGLLQTPQAPTPLPASGIKPPLTLLCWPFALGFILLAILASLWLLGRRPVSTGPEMEG
jgi:hypothetical protein